MLPLLLLILVALARQEDDYRCIPGGPSLGVSLPRGASYLRHSTQGPGIQLQCLLAPTTSPPAGPSSILVGGPSLSFRFNGTTVFGGPEGQGAIETTFLPSTPGVTEVDCLLGERGVCKQSLYVGWEPQPVEGLSCVSSDWETLSCSWREPWNPVPTQYRAHLRATKGHTQHFKECLNRTAMTSHLARRGVFHVFLEGRERLLTSLEPGLSFCYLDEETDPAFRSTVAGGLYTLYINRTNPLLPSGEVESHRVSVYSSVRPGPPEAVSLHSPSSTALALSWTSSKQLRAFPEPLQQRVRWREEGGVWREADTTLLAPTVPSREYRLQLDQLTPFTPYTVEVSMRPGVKGALHWSPTVSVNATTLGAPPSRPPFTHRAGWASREEVGGGRSVVLYWQEVARREQGGPEFRYTVRRSDGSVVLETPDTHVVLPGLSSARDYTFTLAATNSLGSSVASSQILVPAASPPALQPEGVTTVYQSPGNYSLQWRKGGGVGAGYTVFWCKAALGEECREGVRWLEVGAGRERAEVAVEGEGRVRLGVAEGGDGIVWSECTVVEGRVAEAVPRQLKVWPVSSSRLVMDWALGCSEGAGVVEGFLVKACREGGQCRETRLAVTDDREVSGLLPYTNYTVTVALQLPKVGRGRPSLPITVRTKSAAPSTPPALLPAVVTNSSALLSWRPPVAPNGPIASYEVRWGQAGDRARVASRQVAGGQRLEVEGLLAYTPYSWEVRACTERAPQCWGPWSPPSSLHTTVGAPGRPGRPRVVFLNSSTAEVAWEVDFQVGAPEVASWQVRLVPAPGQEGGQVPGAGQEEGQVSAPGQEGGQVPGALQEVRERPIPDQALSLSLAGPRRRVVADLTALLTGRDCTNTTALHRYSVTIRALVQPPSGPALPGPWSTATTLPAYCPYNTPWQLIVIVVIGLIVAGLCIILCFVRTGEKLKRKWLLFSRIGKGLDAAMPSAPAPLEMVERRREEGGRFNMARVEGGRFNMVREEVGRSDSVVLLTPRNKSVSGCSRDSGVSEVTLGPSGRDDCAPLGRQHSTAQSGASGYLSMERGSPRSTLTRAPSSSLAPAPAPGYSQVSSPYVAAPALPTPALPNASPGYISIGAVGGGAELVLQPNPACQPYSRVGLGTGL